MPRAEGGLDLVRLGADVEARCMSRNGKRSGDNVQFNCPASGHEDKRPSASYSISKQAWYCHSCSASGGLATGDFPLAALYGFDLDNYNGATNQTRAPVVSQPSSATDERPIKEATPTPVGAGQSWHIKDETGQHVATHHRQDNSDGSKKYGGVETGPTVLMVCPWLTCRCTDLTSSLSVELVKTCQWLSAKARRLVTVS